MLEMTTFNKRENRWILTRPEAPEEQRKAVMVALALGWLQREIAKDWQISITRVQQLKRQGERKFNDLAETLREIEE